MKALFFSKMSKTKSLLSIFALSNSEHTNYKRMQLVRRCRQNFASQTLFQTSHVSPGIFGYLWLFIGK